MVIRAIRASKNGATQCVSYQILRRLRHYHPNQGSPNYLCTYKKSLLLSKPDLDACSITTYKHVLSVATNDYKKKTKFFKVQEPMQGI